MKKSIEEKLAEWRGLHKPGNPPKLWLDDELREYIDELAPKLADKEIHSACVKRFGNERTPSITSIQRYFDKKIKKGELAPRPRKISKIEADPRLKEFVDDLLPNTGFVEISRLCHERFGSVIAPSHAAIGRYWQKLQRIKAQDKKREDTHDD